MNVFPWHVDENSFKLTLKFYISTMEFYVNSEPPDEYYCHRDLIPDFNHTTIFNLAYQIHFIYGMNYGPGLICPYIFKHSNLNEMDLHGQTDSFLYTSLLRFQNNNTNDTKSINSSMHVLNVYGYNYKIDTGLLHPVVFETLSRLNLYNTIGSIQTDLFKHFQRVTGIALVLDSAENFYHQIGIDWMADLPSAAKINVATGYSVIQSLYNYSLYTYPDKDLCLFAHFPQNKSISLCPFDVNDISGRVLLNCTSTLKWLSRGFNDTSYPDYRTGYLLCSSSHYTGPSDRQIDAKLKLCNLSLLHKEALPSYPDYYETRLLGMLLIELQNCYVTYRASNSKIPPLISSPHKMLIQGDSVRNLGPGRPAFLPTLKITSFY
jgi:hypothetical protein